MGMHGLGEDGGAGMSDLKPSMPFRWCGVGIVFTTTLGLSALQKDME